VLHPQTFGHRAAVPYRSRRSICRPGSPSSGGQGKDTSTFYLGRFDASGQLEAAFSWPAHVEPIVEISDGLVIGNYAPLNRPGLDFPAMLLDLNTATIHPLQEIADALRVEGSVLNPFIVAAQPLPTP
jgi:hypothetical protein